MAGPLGAGLGIGAIIEMLKYAEEMKRTNNQNPAVGDFMFRQMGIPPGLLDGNAPPKGVEVPQATEGDKGAIMEVLKQLSKLDPGHPKAGGMPYGPSPEHSPIMHLIRAMSGQNPRQGGEQMQRGQTINGKR